MEMTSSWGHVEGLERILCGVMAGVCVSLCVCVEGEGGGSGVEIGGIGKSHYKRGPSVSRVGPFLDEGVGRVTSLIEAFVGVGISPLQLPRPCLNQSPGYLSSFIPFLLSLFFFFSSSSSSFFFLWSFLSFCLSFSFFLSF